MKKLADLVEIVENNEECVVLKIKENSKLDLIKLGCFNGNEEFIRYTKGANHTITIFPKDEKSYSWDFGDNGYTLVSDRLSNVRKKVQFCIERDFDIYCDKNLELIKSNLKDLKNKTLRHSIKLIYNKGSENSEICVHKDGEYYGRFENYNSTLEHFKELNFEIKEMESFIARTGVLVEGYEISKENPFYKEQKKLENEEEEEFE